MKFNQAYDRKEFEILLKAKLFGDNYKSNLEALNIDRKTIFFDDKNCFILGKVNLDRDIYILEIKQKSQKDPRITLTKDAFKVMEDIGANYALVIFYSDDSSSYRLSLLTRKKVWGEKEESDPKRYSFLLGVGEKIKTPERFLKETVNNFDDLVDRFNVEVVRKEFFNHYIELFIRLYSEIIKDLEFTKLLNSQKIDLVNFTKTLLGKIVFLYFIQKKGWLGVEKDKIYGKDGDKDFMRNFWLDFTKNEQKTVWEKTGYFYNDYLEHIFYEGLNKDNRDNDDLNDYFNFKVPYLNGGLFKKDYENWNINKSTISNDIFSNDQGTGILDIFDTYNFTVDEDDLYDKEIAVDPEMLGRIFEKMISISSENIGTILEEYNKNQENGKKKKISIDNVLNKKLGAFYTPREIVHYMTKESLIAYLVNNLKGKKEDKESKVRILFDIKERFLLNKDDLKATELSETIFDEIADIVEEVDLLLQKVKIIDPAIGSGAFPMGILHEISSIRYYIYGVFYKTFGINTNTFKDENGKISMYKIKRDIIGNNIFGVDISSGAIEIARLRFWLSLVVDEENPEPLPNFEFKFVCANTLIPLEEEQEQKSIEFDGVKEINLETLRKYMNSYYNAESNKDKEEWKGKIENFLGIGKNLVLDLHNTKTARTKQLETYKPFDSTHSSEFFDPSLMMGNSKFDIVIGNPPYIDSEAMVKDGLQEIRNIIQKKYNFTKGNWDIYIAFFEYGYNILNSNGILTYITPDKWLGKSFGDELRKSLISKIFLILSAGRKVFENAKIDSIITFISKKESKSLLIFEYLKNKLINKKYSINKNSINSPYNLDYFFSDYLPILNKINLEKFNFKNYISCENACATSDAYKIKELLFNDKSLERLKLINTGTISKYSNRWGVKEITYLGEKLLYPTVDKSEFLKNFSNSYGVKSTKRKIIIKGLNLLDSFIDELGDFIPGKTTLVICDNNLNTLKFFLGLLNSKLIYFYIKNKYISSSYNGGVSFTKDMINNIPIKQISEELQLPFIEKVDKILEITKQPGYNPKEVPEEQKRLEKEIDKMVYELYGLSEEEVRVVEESLV